MVEGSYPKSDGEIFYASEANTFANAGELLRIGSTAFFTSGNVYQTIGSFLVPAGSLASPAYIRIQEYVIASAGSVYPRFTFSGTSTNGSMWLEGGTLSDKNVMVDAYLGSPMNGHLYALYDNALTGNAELNNFNTAAAFVVFLGAKYAGAGSFQVALYHAQGYSKRA